MSTAIQSRDADLINITLFHLQQNLTFQVFCHANLLKFIHSLIPSSCRIWRLCYQAFRRCDPVMCVDKKSLAVFASQRLRFRLKRPGEGFIRGTFEENRDRNVEVFFLLLRWNLEWCSGKATTISTENHNRYQGNIEHIRTQALLHDAFRDPDDGSTEVRDWTVLLILIAAASHLNSLGYFSDRRVGT